MSPITRFCARYLFYGINVVIYTLRFISIYCTRMYSVIRGRRIYILFNHYFNSILTLFLCHFLAKFLKKIDGKVFSGIFHINTYLKDYRIMNTKLSPHVMCKSNFKMNCFVCNCEINRGEERCLNVDLIQKKQTTY